MRPIHRLLTWSPSILLALACTTSGASVDQEGALRATLAAYDSAWDTKDTAALDTLLAPEYLYFSSMGELSRKARVLAFVADTSYALTSSHRSEVELFVEGTLGRVSSRWEGQGRYQGAVVNDDQSCGLTWILRGGKWFLLTEHCTDRKPSVGAPS